MKDIREGDLHKTVVVEDTVFEIRYGYTSEEERGRWDPAPLYPDFVKIPMFTPDGFLFATVYQDGCRHFREKPLSSGERWCGDCRHFEKCEEYIGICRREKKLPAYTTRKSTGETNGFIASAELAEA